MNVLERILHRLDRSWNHVRATLGSYFWLPCPLCGEMFGGHEVDKEPLMTSLNAGECVCRRCGTEARRLTLERMKKWRDDQQVLREAEHGVSAARYAEGKKLLGWAWTALDSQGSHPELVALIRAYLNPWEAQT